MVGKDEIDKQVPNFEIRPIDQENFNDDSSDRNSKYPRMLYAAVVLLAIVVISAITVAGSLWRTDSLKDTPLASVDITTDHELDHELTVDGHPSDVRHHEDAVLAGNSSELGDVFEVTLHAVDGLSWRFEPAVMEIPAGHRVKLTLNNEGLVEHDVKILGIYTEDIDVDDGGEGHDRLGGGHHEDGVVAAHAEPGTTASVFFTATAPGTYKYFCTIPGHEAAGMVGKLVVTN